MYTCSNVSMVYQCVGCELMSLQPLGLKCPKNDDWKFSLPSGITVSETCVHCGHKFRVRNFNRLFSDHLSFLPSMHVTCILFFKLGGPIWTGPLHDSNFIDAMLQKVEHCELVTTKRIVGMLSLIQEELADVPLYYTVDALCGKIHCQMIPLVEFRFVISYALVFFLRIMQFSLHNMMKQLMIGIAG